MIVAISFSLVAAAVLISCSLLLAKAWTSAHRVSPFQTSQRKSDATAPGRKTRGVPCYHAGTVRTVGLMMVEAIHLPTAFGN